MRLRRRRCESMGEDVWDHASCLCKGVCQERQAPRSSHSRTDVHGIDLLVVQQFGCVRVPPRHAMPPGEGLGALPIPALLSRPWWLWRFEKLSNAGIGNGTRQIEQTHTRTMTATSALPGAF